jgi:hypothetical protein
VGQASRTTRVEQPAANLGRVKPDSDTGSSTHTHTMSIQHGMSILVHRMFVGLGYQEQHTTGAMPNQSKGGDSRWRVWHKMVESAWTPPHLKKSLQISSKMTQ